MSKLRTDCLYYFDVSDNSSYCVCYNETIYDNECVNCPELTVYNSKKKRWYKVKNKKEKVIR